MPQPAKCPFCGSSKVTSARFRDIGEGYTSLTFQGVKPFPWWKYGHESRDVAYDHSPSVCLQCGMLWTQIKLAEARKLIEEHGPQELKALLSGAGEKPR